MTSILNILMAAPEQLQEINERAQHEALNGLIAGEEARLVRDTQLVQGLADKLFSQHARITSYVAIHNASDFTEATPYCKHELELGSGVRVEFTTSNRYTAGRFEHGEGYKRGGLSISLIDLQFRDAQSDTVNAMMAARMHYARLRELIPHVETSFIFDFEVTGTQEEYRDFAIANILQARARLGDALQRMMLRRENLNEAVAEYTRLMQEKAAEQAAMDTALAKLQQQQAQDLAVQEEVRREVRRKAEAARIAAHVQDLATISNNPRLIEAIQRIVRFELDMRMGDHEHPHGD